MGTFLKKARFHLFYMKKLLDVISHTKRITLSKIKSTTNKESKEITVKYFLEKISSYNILNCLFPGSIYVVVISRFTSFKLLQSDILITGSISYFCGVVISRVGSILIEPLLRKTNIVQYSNYPEFIIASKKDIKIEILSETNNSYRNYISCSICSLLTFLYDKIQNILKISSDISFLCIVLILTALFILSHRKQTEYISIRIKKAMEE